MHQNRRHNHKSKKGHIFRLSNFLGVVWGADVSVARWAPKCCRQHTLPPSCPRPWLSTECDPHFPTSAFLLIRAFLDSSFWAHDPWQAPVWWYLIYLSQWWTKCHSYIRHWGLIDDRHDVTLPKGIVFTSMREGTSWRSLEGDDPLPR